MAVKELIYFKAKQGMSADADPISWGGREGIVVALFDDSTDESLIFQGSMPPAYGGSGVRYYPIFAHPATSGNIVWSLAWEKVDNGNSLLTTAGGNFASAVSFTVAVPSTSGHICSAYYGLVADGAEMDSVGAGEVFRVKLTRDANNSNDTASGDAQLIGLLLEERP